MDSYALKFSGKAELSEPLKLGKNYRIDTEGQVIKTEKHDNQDGTNTEIATFKPILIKFSVETGETIKVKDVRSQSQKLRGVLWKEWNDNQENIDADTYYAKRMGEIIKAVIEGRI